MNETLHSKRWLVVDDDPAVLALTTRVLRSLPGSIVVPCDNPRQALAMFMADPESFEMLVTDFDMPSLDGFELSRRIRVQSPRLPILPISGSGLETADVLRAGLDAFLSSFRFARNSLKRSLKLDFNDLKQGQTFFSV